MNMKLSIMPILAFMTGISASAITPPSIENIDNQGVESVAEDAVKVSNTIPVLYIETEDHTPVDQKVTYIDGTYWLDASMTDDFESIGSAESPLPLGIRGRGNSSWLHDKKPYKLKLDKKQPLMGMNKSKHFVLLTYIGSWTCYFSEPIAFRIGDALGMPWSPTVEPVEVVLNGDYMGLYFLAENVRVESTRVDVDEQEDMCDDPELAKTGWLVEIDNYADDYQLLFTEPKNQTLRLTLKSPEILSETQTEYITTQFNEIIENIYNPNKLSRGWEEYIDIDECVKEYIVQELIHNRDAYNGSFFLHKDTGTKWKVGPLWDLGSAGFNDFKNKLVLDDTPSYSRVKLMKEIVKYPRFQKRLSEIWKEFVAGGTEWIEEFASQWNEKIKIASENDYALWPQYGRQNSTSVMGSTVRIYNYNIKFLDSLWGVDHPTYNVAVSCDSADGEVLIDGLSLADADLLPGMDVTLQVVPAEGNELSQLLVNDVDVTSQVVNGEYKIAGVDTDYSVTAHFGSSSGINGPSSDAVKPVITVQGNQLTINNVEPDAHVEIYDVSGRAVYSGIPATVHLPQSGFYIIVVNGNVFKQIICG